MNKLGHIFPTFPPPHVHPRSFLSVLLFVQLQRDLNQGLTPLNTDKADLPLLKETEIPVPVDRHLLHDQFVETLYKTETIDLQIQWTYKTLPKLQQNGATRMSIFIEARRLLV